MFILMLLILTYYLMQLTKHIYQKKDIVNEQSY